MLHIITPVTLSLFQMDQMWLFVIRWRFECENTQTNMTLCKQMWKLICQQGGGRIMSNTEEIMHSWTHTDHIRCWLYPTRKLNLPVWTQIKILSFCDLTKWSLKKWEHSWHMLNKQIPTWVKCHPWNGFVGTTWRLQCSDRTDRCQAVLSHYQMSDAHLLTTGRESTDDGSAAIHLPHTSRCLEHHIHNSIIWVKPRENVLQMQHNKRQINQWPYNHPGNDSVATMEVVTSAMHLMMLTNQQTPQEQT